MSRLEQFRRRIRQCAQMDYRDPAYPPWCEELDRMTDEEIEDRAAELSEMDYENHLYKEATCEK